MKTKETKRTISAKYPVPMSTITMFGCDNCAVTYICKTTQKYKKIINRTDSVSGTNAVAPSSVVFIISTVSSELRNFFCTTRNSCNDSAKNCTSLKME